MRLLHSRGLVILRDILFIIIFGIFLYLGVATIINDGAIIGSVGADFAHANIQIFGYISYIYLFLFMIPIYYLYKYNHKSFIPYELLGVFILTLILMLFFQAMVIDGSYRGTLFGAICDTLIKYIGNVGLWIVWFALLLATLVISLEQSLLHIIKQTLPIIKPNKKYSDENHNESQIENTPFFDEEPQTHDIFEPKIENHSQIQHIDDIVDETPPITEPVTIKTPSTTITQNKQDTDILQISQHIKETKQSAVVVNELEENKKLLEQIDKGTSSKPKNFTLPKVEFFQLPQKKHSQLDELELDEKIKDLIQKLKHFNIDGDVIRTYSGPVVSTFEFKPAANIKVSKILGLQDDLAMALRAQTIRIQAPIPGKDVVGIEIPNKSVDTIYIREILDSTLFKESASPLTLILGKDIVGKPFITDLKKLPHLLIAGTTGSGKSVGINAMILSLLYKNSPDDLRLMMIDPKMLEFSIYNDIPHLLTPVITKPKEAIVALNNMVYEMERRYRLMSETKTKNIENYNEKATKEKLEKLPYIVVIIDELADLMMTSGKDVEHSIARLAQMARASGIHLIVATQRPSVDVVTGLIKANLPSRISYKVGQKIDSKIILDSMGAESLLGRGDMLFTPPGMSGIIRLHAPWSTEGEIEKVVEFLKSQREPLYDKRFLKEESTSTNNSSNSGDLEEIDELYDEAKEIVLSERKATISYLQRRLQIGYNRSARIIEQLEAQGVLSEPNAKGNREILV